MSFVQLFVEDRLSDSYEILAARALGFDTSRRPQRRQYVRAAQLDINVFTTKDGMLDSVERAAKTGSRCILFILDAEDYNRSPDRSRKLTEYCDAFENLCRHLSALPNGNYLKQVRVACIITKSCLECWLLADPQGIVSAFNGPSSYTPTIRNTENHNPKSASEQIAHIINEVGRRTQKRNLIRIGSRSIKSEGAKIAQHIDPETAAKNNTSLNRFYEMIRCEKSDCDQLSLIRT